MAMKKFLIMLVLAPLQILVCSCDKLKDVLLEESDDTLCCDYFVQMSEPKLNMDCTYTLSAKFSDMKLFNRKTMRACFYVSEYDYTPHDGIYTTGPSIEGDWILNDTLHYKWVDVLEDGEFSYSFLPVNKQYFCIACVVERLEDGMMMLINSKSFMLQGNLRMSIVLEDTLCNGFRLTFNRGQVKKMYRKWAFVDRFLISL